MKFRNSPFCVYCLLVLSLSALSSCDSDDEETPGAGTTISGISPDTGPSGTQVTISGSGFGDAPGENIVKFNGTEAVVLSASANQIVAEVPDGAGTGKVTVAVGGNIAEGPVFTYTEPPTATAYFIYFKANGSAKLFEDGNPGYQVCGDCSCSYLPALDETRNAGIDICQISDVTAALIENLKNKTVPFKDDGFPIAAFGFEENNISYHTDYVDQGTNTVTISNVVADGTFNEKKAYKVTGTFSCKVAKSDGTSVTTITDGQFTVRYTEDF